MLTSNRHLGSATTAEAFAFLKARAVARGVRLEQADIDACGALQKQLFEFLRVEAAAVTHAAVRADEQLSLAQVSAYEAEASNVAGGGCGDGAGIGAGVGIGGGADAGGVGAVTLSAVPSNGGDRSVCGAGVGVGVGTGAGDVGSAASTQSGSDGDRGGARAGASAGTSTRAQTRLFVRDGAGAGAVTPVGSNAGNDDGLPPDSGNDEVFFD